ncbi:helix-turn-helix domain-containing protein [Lactococcus lactis subsp. lactis]|jgi:transposase|nr:helix-turn-helix domain-containing protein [Lactococcus lactis subsp. lactis]
MHNFNRYNNEFKKTFVSLHMAGESKFKICSKYGISSSTFSIWFIQFSNTNLSNKSVITAKEIIEYQTRNAKLTKLAQLKIKILCENNY